METYKWLAVYYDHLFEFRRTWAGAHKRIVYPLLPQVASACDLCCGTGDTALLFAGRGIRTFAVDLSAEMCRITRRKAREAGLPVRVFQSDMRDFRLPQPVDLITCEFDAINHVPRKRDLARVFMSVAAALRPGGYFVFDVNNRKAFEQVWTLTWFIDKDPVAAVMRSGHKAGTDRAWIDVEWFVRKGRTWTRRRERVEEVCWSAEEIRDTLARAGFGRIRRWDAGQFFNDQFIRPGQRTFWLARREGSA
jgi:SAM-dependent methyltransferase